MRVVLYAHHTLFEPALSLTSALADRAEVHLFLEVPSGRWEAANFVAVGDLGAPGIKDGDALLAGVVPEETRAMWLRAASFHLVVTGEDRSRDRSSVRLMREVLARMRALEPDLLHVDDTDVSQRLAAGLLLSARPCPILVGCHDPEPHSGERDWLTKRLTRAVLFARAHAVLVHHRFGRQALARRHPLLRTPVQTVLLAAYTFLRNGRAQESRHSTSPTVLFFGRLTPYKGLENLYAALPGLWAVLPQVRVVVAGRPEGGYRPPAPPTAPAGSSDVETHHRYVGNEEAARLFREGDVVVCPYTDASQSGVVLTAYGFGTPVVVTAVGGLPEYVSDGVTGLVVPPGDPTALARALTRCLTEPRLLDRLGEGVAAAAAGQLGWGRVASELLVVYADVLSGRRGRRGRRGR